MSEAAEAHYQRGIELQDAGKHGSWQGVFVPTGTPKEIIDRLYAAVQQTLRSPEVVERLTRSGVDVVLSSSQEAFAEFVAVETQRWGRVAKEAGATPY